MRPSLWTPRPLLLARTGGSHAFRHKRGQLQVKKKGFQS